VQTIFEFGDAKLAAVDLDPLYVAAVRMPWGHVERCRFTLAEVAFDLAGKAAEVVERCASGMPFWDSMRAAAADTKRGAPRRYFRGPKCMDALEVMRELYPDAPEALAALAGTFAHAEEVVCGSWPLWGPTAAFKIADMAERVCQVPVDFGAVGETEICSNAQVRKGWDKARDVLAAAGDARAQDLAASLRQHIWCTKAPPRWDRELGPQEWETLLCYYSHDDEHNHHLPGMDRLGIAEELYDHGDVAAELLGHLPWATEAEMYEWLDAKHRRTK